MYKHLKLNSTTVQINKIIVILFSFSGQVIDYKAGFGMIAFKLEKPPKKLVIAVKYSFLSLETRQNRGFLFVQVVLF